MVRMCEFVLSFVFFFKQKTAYEMRISDWSSDVCSSDLFQPRVQVSPKPQAEHIRSHEIDRDRGGQFRSGSGYRQRQDDEQRHKPPPARHADDVEQQRADGIEDENDGDVPERVPRISRCGVIGDQPRQLDRVPRSEEHTSELQSLMRISYAVFCLKKKKQIKS